MCNFPGGLFSRSLPTGAGDAGGSDDRGKEENKGRIAYFGGINKCKFKGKIVPGDKVKLETKIIKQKGPLGVGEAIASVDGKVVVSAELTFMVG